MAHGHFKGRVATIRALTPKENILTQDNHGRMRSALDDFILDTDGGAHKVLDGDIVQFGGPDLPINSKILGGSIHVDQMQTAGLSSVRLLIDNEQNMLDRVDPALIEMTADGNADMTVMGHTEYHILPTEGTTGSVCVPLLPYDACLYVVVSTNALGWDIDGAAMVITLNYVLD